MTFTIEYYLTPKNRTNPLNFPLSEVWETFTHSDQKLKEENIRYHEGLNCIQVSVKGVVNPQQLLSDICEKFNISRVKQYREVSLN